MLEPFLYRKVLLLMKKEPQLVSIITPFESTGVRKDFAIFPLIKSEQLKKVNSLVFLSTGILRC